MRNRIDQTPDAKATTQLTAQGTAPTAASLRTASRPSSRAAPAITGTARRKENSAALAGARPPHSAAAMVEPEREMAGRIANACAKPRPVAPLTDGKARPPRGPRVHHRMSPVTRNWAASQTNEWNCCSIWRWNSVPIRPAGMVATTRDRKSTRLNSSHSQISYAVFCLKKKKNKKMKHAKESDEETKHEE